MPIRRRTSTDSRERTRSEIRERDRAPACQPTGRRPFRLLTSLSLCVTRIASLFARSPEISASRRANRRPRRELPRSPSCSGEHRCACRGATERAQRRVVRGEKEQPRSRCIDRGCGNRWVALFEARRYGPRPGLERATACLTADEWLWRSKRCPVGEAWRPCASSMRSIAGRQFRNVEEHMPMRDARLHVDVSLGCEAEPLVEGEGVGLG